MYVNRRFYDKYVSTRDVELLHEYSLRVLKEVGVSFDCPEALEIFKKHGATVEGSIVKIDEDLLNQALETAPKTFTVTTSAGETKIGERFKPKTVGCYGPPKFLFEDDEYRVAMKDDMVKFLKLMDTSDVTDFVNNSAYDTADLDKTKDDFYMPQVAMCLKYSQKPTYGNVANSLNVRGKSLKEAAKGIAQLYKEFYDIWDRPVLLTNACALSPLGYSYEVLDNIMGLVEEGQPVTIITCSMTNLTAPAALLGSVIQNNATILAGIVLTQLINPGCPVIYGTVSSPTDMRTVSLAIGAPEAQLIQMASLALGRYYQLPVRTGIAGTDSLKPDYQAGVESFMILMTTYLGKSDFVLNHAGILQSYALGSYEKFVLDEEVNRILMRLNRGMDISDMRAEKVFAEIKKAGPLGNYLSGRTPKEYRQEHWLTKLFNRQAGNPQPIFDEIGDLRERASKEVEERVAGYTLPDLTKTQKDILNRYLPEDEKF
ncbi:trimethylamine methyltransferase family protein [Eubacterium callanderi]|uniref:trimethylamine methyltransferase family protein n=1 Tax=Eubacterium callanderi TaxID=53442 RepID=UPI001C104026|nr:trimethylamine methyltransferase family protein [Eubacterium callanderi]MBU5303037.1 trimethylamine methyltransferase family protein [Eubacterium callanderi]